MDPLGSILNYFVQQSVAHGAMFFASMLASWSFVQIATRNRDEVRRRGVLGIWTVVGIGMVLFALCYYVSIKLVMYGQLSYMTLTLNVKPEELVHLSNQTFADYYDLVTNNTLQKPYYGDIFMLSGGVETSGFLRIFYILVLSAGFATSFLINWLFDLFDTTIPALAVYLFLEVVFGISYAYAVCHYTTYATIEEAMRYSTIASWSFLTSVIIPSIVFTIMFYFDRRSWLRSVIESHYIQ